MADDSIDGNAEDLVTPAAAAAWFGVGVNTIRNWRLAGILTPARFLPNGQHRYRRGDLWALNDRLSKEPPAE